MRNWLAGAIKFARIRAQLSASKASKLAGYSSSYVAKIESGKLEPSAIGFARLARVLSLTDEEIVWIIRLIGGIQNDEEAN